MMNYIIPLLATMSPLWDYVLTTLMCMMFVATVPCILRYIIKGGKKNV